jgi:hypothetical protein
MSIESVHFNKKKFLTDPRMTFEELTKYVNRMGLSPELTSRLLNKARSLPGGSLSHFYDNIQVHIASLNRDEAAKSHRPIEENNNGNSE